MKKITKFLFYMFSKRPKVYWWSINYLYGNKNENFGDFLTPYIVNKLTDKQVILFSPESKFSYFFKHSLMVGSIIYLSNKRTVVWGSGIIKENEKIKGGRFVLVRGPRTAKRLKELGLKPPNCLGDPALILPFLYAPEIKKKYKLGIISHFVDFDDIELLINNNENINHINLLTNNVENVIDEILSCEKIISTSLHGLIVADAYQIPNIWWKYSSKLNGDDVKFYDYFESVNRLNVKYTNDYSLSDIVEKGKFVLADKTIIETRQEQILSSFPYKIKSKMVS